MFYLCMKPGERAAKLAELRQSIRYCTMAWMERETGGRGRGGPEGGICK